MPRIPWFKFYVSDWRGDPALRMCSIAARGLWIEMLCLMHEAEPRGSLLVNGHEVDPKRLASLAGITVREVSKCVKELEAAGVFSREDKGTIYSRRMRREAERMEADRSNGRLGGNPQLKCGVNPPGKLPDNLEDKTQNLEPEDRLQKQHQEARKTLASLAARAKPVDEDLKEAPATDKPGKPKRRPGVPFPDNWELGKVETTVAGLEGLLPSEVLGEFEKFADQARDKGVLSFDWAARWRNWCREAARRLNRSPRFKIDLRSKAETVFIHAEQHPAQWAAWQDYYRRTKGAAQGTPTNSQGGWYFASEWPPRTRGEGRRNGGGTRK